MAGARLTRRRSSHARVAQVPAGRAQRPWLVAGGARAQEWADPELARRETLVAVARTFTVSESTVTAVAFETMGYDRVAVRREADLSTASTEQIVRAMAVMLGVKFGAEGGDGHGLQPAPIDEDDNAGGAVAKLPAMAAEARRRANGPGHAMPADLAARRIRRKSRTQETRDQQDQDARE